MIWTHDHIAFLLFAVVVAFVLGYMNGGRDRNDAE